MKIFIDANVLLDKFDNSRVNYKYSQQVFEHCILNDFEIYTSCDLITTIYYINAKVDKKNALKNIQLINQTINIISFSNLEIDKACNLMLIDSDYKDLEDTLQYILALKEDCDIIVSNDLKFTSKDIELLTSKGFIQKFVNS